METLLAEVFTLRPCTSLLPPYPACAFLYCDHWKQTQFTFSHQETGIPKVQAISSLSDDSDLELDELSLSILEGTPIGTTGALSHIFAVSKDRSTAATVPFEGICTPRATDSDTQGQDTGTASSRPLIQELKEDELAEGESNQSLPPQTCASDPELAQSSEDGDSQPPAATPIGNTLKRLCREGASSWSNLRE